MAENAKKVCGIIMPISAHGAYSAEFWEKVKRVVCEAITLAGMTPHPVWEDEKNDIIHAKIIRNIDTLPVIIGVIVGQNPNVMLECGMRLWKNLPILLLHGTGEKIPFDVSPIPCVPFPSGFDYFQIQELKDEVAQRLRLMVEPDYKSFKSYYSLPAEVDVLGTKDKMDFNQFVEEIRGGFNSLATELRDSKRIIEEHIRDSMDHGYRPDSSSLSTGTYLAYPYYQMGATGPMGATLGYEASCTKERMPMGCTGRNDALSGEASVSTEEEVKMNGEA